MSGKRQEVRNSYHAANLHKNVQESVGKPYTCRYARLIEAFTTSNIIKVVSYCKSCGT